ncbi:hypothetical protein Rhopal_007309-T1 [Rhodotorula paludigena]|uniref:Uncharacterized protein n=1 Tax=Rhodotorula paludigena TaxID=86838 RepID=A0AAV5GNT5_9BASI|nr:hypothetical protein Rhopal_007309-T1 [Rhodotorula paludigena]
MPRPSLGVNDNVLGHFHRLFPAATDAAMSSNRARDTCGTRLVLLLAKDQWLLEWCASTLGWFRGTAYKVTDCRGTFGGKDLTFAVLDAQPSDRNLSIITRLPFTITGYRVILFNFPNRSALWNKSADDGARLLVYERMDKAVELLKQAAGVTSIAFDMVWSQFKERKGACLLLSNLG